MSVRHLFLILFATSIGATFIFIMFTIRIVWYLLNGILPDYAAFGGYSFPPAYVLLVAAFFLFFLLFFLYALLYLLIDRWIVQPIDIIANAMHEFAEHSHQIKLPRFSRTTNEVKWLAEVFLEFTGSVEKVHEKDMEISRMKSDFISTAAHQLRTPMTGIRWSLEALQKTGLDADQLQLVDSAESKIKDLVAIIGTLLDISAIESGKYKYKFVPLEVEPLLEEITHEFLPLAQTRNITLTYVKSGEKLPKANADTERVKWVIGNLVENAIRYTPQNGMVRIYTSTGLGKVFIQVQDTGIGIKDEDRNNIFERFYRAQNAIEKENSGNGLGLYIARTIAKDHGGDLSFASNTNSPGTTFTFSLGVSK